MVVTLIGQNIDGNFVRAEKSVLITMKYNIIFMFRNFDFQFF